MRITARLPVMADRPFSFRDRRFFARNTSGHNHRSIIFLYGCNRSRPNPKRAWRKARLPAAAAYKSWSRASSAARSKRASSALTSCHEGLTFPCRLAMEVSILLVPVTCDRATLCANPMARHWEAVAMAKHKIKPNYRRRLLRLPDLDHCKRAVLNSLGSPASRRVYEYAIDQFIAWYCSEPRLGLQPHRGCPLPHAPGITRSGS